VSDLGRLPVNMFLAPGERIAVMGTLGVAGPAAEGLAALSTEERAALIASSVEGLPIDDVAGILPRDPAADQAVRMARDLYINAALASLVDMPAADADAADIARRVDRAARRRGRKRAARDGHARFEDWLLSRTGGNPTRQLAMHAAACAICMEKVAALDLLNAVDLSLAGMPPLDAVAPPRPMAAGPWAALALAAAATAVIFNIAIWPADDTTGVAAAWPFGPPLQMVLGGTGAPSPSGSPTGAETAAQPSPDPSLGPAASPFGQPGGSTPPGVAVPSAPPTLGPPAPGGSSPPGASPPGSVPTPTPPAGSTPPPIVPSPSPEPPGTQSPAPTPPPTPRSTPRPTSPPTPRPTPRPTAPPTPPPTPTPEPSHGLLPECADFIDNDHDGLIDLLDPGCLNSLDLTED
jgi:hypothetical protein